MLKILLIFTHSTSDAWTSKNILPFLGITVHWIDENWQLCSTVLEFSTLSGSHSGENLTKRFLEILNDFDIETKVFFYFILFYFIK